MSRAHDGGGGGGATRVPTGPDSGLVWTMMLFFCLFFFLSPRQQKNLLVLGTSAVQPEQRGELLRHAGQLVAGVHRGHLSRHEQQRRRRRRGQRRDEHESDRGAGNQQQSGSLHNGQRRAAPRYPDRASFSSNCECAGPLRRHHLHLHLPTLGRSPSSAYLLLCVLPPFRTSFVAFSCD